MSNAAAYAGESGEKMVSVQIRNYRVLQDFPDWYIINLQIVPNIYWLIKGRQYLTF